MIPWICFGSTNFSPFENRTCSTHTGFNRHTSRRKEPRDSPVFTMTSYPDYGTSVHSFPPVEPRIGLTSSEESPLLLPCARRFSFPDLPRAVGPVTGLPPVPRISRWRDNSFRFCFVYMGRPRLESGLGPVPI